MGSVGVTPMDTSIGEPETVSLSSDLATPWVLKWTAAYRALFSGWILRVLTTVS